MPRLRAAGGPLRARGTASRPEDARRRRHGASAFAGASAAEAEPRLRLAGGTAAPTGAGATGPVAFHAFEPGRYTPLLTIANSRGGVSAFGRLLFVRGPGSTTVDVDPVACPGPGATVPVSVSVRVPSWARMPAQVSFALPTGPCGASASPARDLTITPGNAGNHRDGWGRRESTLRFSFDLSDGTGTGTVTPSVTAGWS